MRAEGEYANRELEDVIRSAPAGLKASTTAGSAAAVSPARSGDIRTATPVRGRGRAPARVRKFVLERDGHCWRVCGRYVERAHLHHIRLRSQGGANEEVKLITPEGLLH